jgi:hypothetical protein
MRTCCFIQPSMAPHSQLPHQPQAKPIKNIRLSCSAKKASHLCVVEVCGLLGCVPRDIAAGLYATGGASCVGVVYSGAANGKEHVQDTVALLQMPHQNLTPHTTAKWINRSAPLALVCALAFPPPVKSTLEGFDGALWSTSINRAFADTASPASFTRRRCRSPPASASSCRPSSAWPPPAPSSIFTTGHMALGIAAAMDGLCVALE